jgi:tetratricopeptide (TPR) repeat protein
MSTARPGRKRLCGAAFVLCLAAAPSLRAEDKPSAPAAVTESAPTAITAPVGVQQDADAGDAQKPADKSAPEAQLEEELARLQKLQVELQAIESLPLPHGSSPAPKAAEEKPDPSPAELPKAPVKGLEEEFANALYALGKYDAAAAVYRQLLESKPKADVQAWARFQVANCAKRTSDLPAAAAAYEDVLTLSAGCPWAPDATWWANEIKWRMRWDQTTK